MIAFVFSFCYSKDFFFATLSCAIPLHKQVCVRKQSLRVDFTRTYLTLAQIDAAHEANIMQLFRVCVRKLRSVSGLRRQGSLAVATPTMPTRRNGDRRLQCAAEGCTYEAHDNVDKFGGYCCKRCGYRDGHGKYCTKKVAMTTQKARARALSPMPQQKRRRRGSASNAVDQTDDNSTPSGTPSGRTTSISISNSTPEFPPCPQLVRHFAPRKQYSDEELQVLVEQLRQDKYLILYPYSQCDCTRTCDNQAEVFRVMTQMGQYAKRTVGAEPRERV